MGLDVSVYKNVKLLPEVKTYDDFYDNHDGDGFKAFVINKDWEDRISNLEIDGFYTGDYHDPNIGYSYGGHSWFRNLLAQLISEKTPKGFIEYIQDPEHKFFIEFINFADNEGCIDWGTSEKLYNDFVAWKERAETFGKKMGEDGHYFVKRYEKWMEAFKVAGENKGVVVYH